MTTQSTLHRNVFQHPFQRIGEQIHPEDHQSQSPSARGRMWTIVFATFVLLGGAASAVLLVPNIQVGGNDFLISFMGNSGETLAADGILARDPESAYSATSQRVLVVWAGVDDATEGQEIWGQILDSTTGGSIGSDFLISDSGDASRTANDPAVAWDSERNRFLVVWSSDATVEGEFEVRGQLVSVDGDEEGIQDFLISSMGPVGDSDYDARQPRVAFNTTQDEYLVIWSGDHDTGDLVDDEFEIWAQPVDGAFPVVFFFDPTQVTSYGPAGDPTWDTHHPDLVYNPDLDEYVVVFEAEYCCPDSDIEIFGRRLRGSDQLLLGAREQLSHMSKINAGFENVGRGLRPSITYNPVDQEYFVVWHGTGWSNFVGEKEVWGGRRTASDLAPIPFSNSQQLTQAGPEGADFHSRDADVTFDHAARKYAVVYRSDHINDNEYEISVLLVNTDGDPQSGAPEAGLRISDLGGWDATSPDNTFDGQEPTIVATGTEHMVVWAGDDDEPWLGNDDLEIFGQRIRIPGTLFTDGFESGGTGAWSSQSP